jgi:hypothetical protein
MPVPADLFGTAYLDAESFREMRTFFGAQMSVASYPDTDEGNANLDRALQAASRAIDAFCGKHFLSSNITENHQLDASWRFSVNNPPVASLVSCVLRFAIDRTMTLDIDNIYVNKQKGYCEIGRLDESVMSVAQALGNEIIPQIEVVYKSLQSVPHEVKLAAGYQTAYMLNNGFVESSAPAQMGVIDLGGLKINNVKGRRSSDEQRALALCPEAQSLLQAHRRITVA